MKIIHIADIHIITRNHDRIYYALDTLISHIRGMMVTTPKNELMIVIAGDIFEDKANVNADNLKVFNRFMSSLDELGIYILIIPGNHDFDGRASGGKIEHVRDMIDAAISHDNVYENIEYIRETSYIEIRGISFVILSPIDNEDVCVTSLPHPRVAILHDSIKSAGSGRYIVSNGRFSIESFTDYDAVICGDLHEHQILGPNLNIAYSGSFVQKNRGEGIDHGYMIWDVDPLIKSPCPIIPRYVPLPAFNVDLRVGLTGELPDVVSVRSVTLEAEAGMPVLDRKAQIIAKYGRLDKINYIEKSVSFESIDENLIVSSTPDEIKALHHKYETHEKINNRWELCYLYWSNIFKYGVEPSWVNIELFDGIGCIYGQNSAGKSNIINIFMALVFDNSCSTKGAVTTRDVLLNNTNTADGYIECMIRVKSDVYKIKYSISRKGPHYDILSVSKNNEIIHNGDKKYVRDYVQSIIGQKDDFLLVPVVLQCENNLFTRQPAERVSFLRRALGLSQLLEKLDQNRENIKETRKELKYALTTLNGIGQNYNIVEVPASSRACELQKMIDDAVASQTRLNYEIEQTTLRLDNCKNLLREMPNVDKRTYEHAKHTSAILRQVEPWKDKIEIVQSLYEAANIAAVNADAFDFNNINLLIQKYNSYQALKALQKLVAKCRVEPIEGAIDSLESAKAKYEASLEDYNYDIQQQFNIDVEYFKFVSDEEYLNALEFYKNNYCSPIVWTAEECQQNIDKLTSTSYQTQYDAEISRLSNYDAVENIEEIRASINPSVMPAPKCEQVEAVVYDASLERELMAIESGLYTDSILFKYGGETLVDLHKKIAIVINGADFVWNSECSACSSNANIVKSCKEHSKNYKRNYAAFKAEIDAILIKLRNTIAVNMAHKAAYEAWCAYEAWREKAAALDAIDRHEKWIRCAELCKLRDIEMAAKRAADIECWQTRLNAVREWQRVDEAYKKICYYTRKRAIQKESAKITLGHVIYYLNNECQKIERLVAGVMSYIPHVRDMHYLPHYERIINIWETNTIKKLQAEEDQLSKQRDNLLNERCNSMAKLCGLQDALNQFNLAYANVAKLEADLKLYEDYHKVMNGPTGVINTIIDNRLKAFQQHWCENLRMLSELQVSINENLEISIYESDNPMTVAVASGYQRLILDLTFRACMFQMADIPMPNFMIIDEGFGVADHSNRTNLKDYLRAFNHKMLIISHVEEISGIASRNISVNMSPEGSVVQFGALPIINIEKRIIKLRRQDQVAHIKSGEDEVFNELCCADSGFGQREGGSLWKCVICNMTFRKEAAILAHFQRDGHIKNYLKQN